MRDNFILSFNIVLPLFLMMALGYFIRRIKLVDKNTLEKLNSLIFRVFLPLLIFTNVYKSDLSSVFDGRLAAFSLCAVLIAFLLLCIVVPIFEKDNSRRGVIIQGIFRSNFVIFGTPLAVSLCGEGISGKVALLTTTVIPLYNVLAVVALEIFRGGKINVKKIALGVITNPLIIGSLLGVLVLVSGLRFPPVVENTLFDISAVTTPLALVVLGGSVDFSSVGKGKMQLFWSVFGRLVLMPAAALFAAVKLGFGGAELAVMLTLFASPAAVSSFNMAQEMGGDGELAAQIVVFGTALSVFTLFLWIFALKQLALI